LEIDPTNNLDFVDDTGERKFVNTKKEERASSFLLEKGKYYLVMIKKSNLYLLLG